MQACHIIENQTATLFLKQIHEKSTSLTFP
jgi:hypothetical protein